ncbi:MAG: DUF6398 domain-containing protein [Pseudomonadota bacterium]
MNERIADKKQRLEEIKGLVLAFCEEHLDDEIYGYAFKLCDMLGQKRKISITRGKKEIWAAAIVYVIARLNFLFDVENEFFLTADTICDFFGTKKSTVGTKATQIEKSCNLGPGAEGFCSPEITDALTFVELSNGLIFPKNMLPELDIVYELADEEDTKKIEQFLEKQRRFKEEKKTRRAETNRKIAEEKKKRKIENDKQLSLFDGFNA